MAFSKYRDEHYHLRILCSAKASSRQEGEVKPFPEKRKLKEFINTRLALQEILKGPPTTRNKNAEAHKTKERNRIRRLRLFFIRIGF